MECKNCGAQIPDNSLVCDVCGASVLDEMSDFNEETRVIDQDELHAAAAASAGAKETAKDEVFDENEKKRQEQIRKMQEDKKKQLSEIERRRSEKRRRQRRKKALIVALICAVAVGGAGIGVYYGAKGINGGFQAAKASPSPSVSTVSPSPSASPSASPASPSPSGVSPSPANTDNQSWTAAANGNTTQTASSGATGSSTNSASGTQRTASNTSSQRTASNTASSGTSSGGSNSGSTSGGGAQAAASKSAPDSGLVSEPISSRSVTGGEVIYNEGTGRYLMTFTMDGKRYYANVSEGSTTEQIKGKSFTINADATQESYGGNTVYEISSMTNTTGSYLFEDSSTRLLTENDIKGMSKYDLALARNEIFARHGRKFQTEEYSRYFSSKSWYKINPNYNYSDDNANLNETEKKNVQFILNAEKR